MQNEYIHIRVKPRIKDMLKELADYNNCSISTYIRNMIISDYNSSFIGDIDYSYGIRKESDFDG